MYLIRENVLEYIEDEKDWCYWWLEKPEVVKQMHETQGRPGCITNLTIWGKLIGISNAEDDAPVNVIESNQHFAIEFCKAYNHFL